jgi:hypothetical protein
VLKENVFAYHTHIGGTVAHVSGHIGSANNNQLDIGNGRCEDEFPATV